MGRDDSDEAHVLDLCGQVLGESGRRQHRFDWLLVIRPEDLVCDARSRLRRAADQDLPQVTRILQPFVSSISNR
jgi:hypothetical protein